MKPLILLLLAFPAHASTVVWNDLEGQYQRQLPELVSYAPKGCRVARVVKDMRFDRVEPIIDCGAPKLMARAPLDMADLFEAPLATGLTTPAMRGSGATNTTGSGSHGSGFGFGSSTSGGGGSQIVSHEVVTPSQVSLPAMFLAFLSGLLGLLAFRRIG